MAHGPVHCAVQRRSRFQTVGLIFCSKCHVFSFTSPFKFLIAQLQISVRFWQSLPWAWLECRVTRGKGQLFALRDDEQGWGAPGAKDSYRPIYPQPSLPFQNNMWQNRQQIQQTQQYQLWIFPYKFMFKSRLSLCHSGNITKKKTRELMFQEKIWKCS